MDEAATRNAENRKKAVIKAAALLLFIVTAVVVVRFTGIKDHLRVESLQSLMDSVGLWTPIAFIFIYAVGVCLFLPGTLLTGLGAALFGPYWGFLIVWVGALMGASMAFWIGRTLGRDFAASLIGDGLKRYDDAIERNGFATVLYLRLIYFPFTPMNFGMGLTKVRFQDYLWGTALGILVGTFVFTFFIGTLRDIWLSGNWNRLLSGKVLFSVALFIGSFFIPKLVKRWRRDEKDSILR